MGKAQLPALTLALSPLTPRQVSSAFARLCWQFFKIGPDSVALFDCRYRVRLICVLG